MPTQRAATRARKDKREGNSAATQAGEFVREEMERLHAGRGDARSPAQAVAIGLAEARRAGVKVSAKKSVRGSKRSDATPAAPAISKAGPAQAKRKTAAKKTVSARAAGATRAARKRAMRARTRCVTVRYSA